MEENLPLVEEEEIESIQKLVETGLPLATEWQKQKRAQLDKKKASAAKKEKKHKITTTTDKEEDPKKKSKIKTEEEKEKKCCEESSGGPHLCKKCREIMVVWLLHHPPAAE